MDPEETENYLRTSLNIFLRLETSFKTPEISSTEGRFCVFVLLLGFTLAVMGDGKVTLMPVLATDEAFLLFAKAEIDSTVAEEAELC